MAYGAKQRIVNRGNLYGQEAFKEMLNVLRNQNDPEVPFYTGQNE